MTFSNYYYMLHKTNKIKKSNYIQIKNINYILQYIDIKIKYN